MSKNQSSNREEVLLQGVPASAGMAMGRVFLHQKKVPVIDTNKIGEDHIQEHLELFIQAKETLKNECEALLEKEEDENSRAILTTQIEIIGDPQLSAEVERQIQEELKQAQWAIHNAFEKYITLFAESDNDMMADRTIDLSDIRDRLIEASGLPKSEKRRQKGDILVAEELSPREVIELSHQNLKGFIAERGGNTSHASIIARSVGIPAVVGAKGILRQIEEGTVVALDGAHGLVSINPSSHTRSRFEKMKGDQVTSPENQAKICQKTSTTSDGHKFIIRANIEFLEELKTVDRYKAEGIGLLRTESIYLNQNDFADAEKQELFYRQVIEQTPDNAPVTIRLFDVGGDKFQGTRIVEENPFLGWRGIRMLLDEREILREQLTAILAAAGEYPDRVKLLVPMVSTLYEIEEVRKEVSAAREKLRKEGRRIDEDIKLGIMAEIPSVAVQAEHFAPQVDFFSIGTNDLTQYLLAVDRGNAHISGLYNQSHPAVWNVIKHTIDVAHEFDTEVEVCGELASYPAAAACLVGMGITSLSMSPASIPAVKKVLISRTMTDIKTLAEDVQECVTLQEIEELFKKWKTKI